MWMIKNAHVYFQPSGHHGLPLNGTQVMLKELKQLFAIFHLCFYYWLAIAVTCIAIRNAILNKMFPAALNETRFKHWPSLAFMAYLRHTVWGWIDLFYHPTAELPRSTN